MIRIFLSIFLFIGFVCSAQPTQEVSTLQETAKTFIRQGDYENAVLVLTKALQMQPNDLQISKDLLFAYYLKRDFAKAMEEGKPMLERADADVQVYQMLGLVYKSVAEEKEAEKLYKRGIKLFPNEGILYSEYGDLIATRETDNAVKLWEKGVEVDPNHSTNYYFLAKQYAVNGSVVWSIVYAEMFLNMESFTARSTEMKNLLLDQYKKFYIAGTTIPAADPKKPISFTAAVAETLNKQQSQVNIGVTPETLTVVRTRFILDWYDKYAARFPFRLFEQQRQLLQEGMFEAYNFWLFGPASNLKTYQTWQQYHQEDLNTFLGFIRSKVFKIPDGQQYRMM